MLDINYIEQNLELVTKRLNSRNHNYTNDLSYVVQKNIKRKELLKKVEEIKAVKNTLSKQVGELIRNKNVEQANEIKNKVADMNIQIEKLDSDLKVVEQKMDNRLRYIPNIPNENMPIGFDDNDNPEVRRFGDEKLLVHQTPH
jgi:seryl-tRNA synthetase